MTSQTDEQGEEHLVANFVENYYHGRKNTLL